MTCLYKLGVGDGRGFARLNRALITLIPKKPDAMEISDFRPISLVHSFAKLFSKLVANRLRLRLGDVVSANQSAFIRGRCLHDNFMLVRQVARRINTRRQTGLLLKLDLSRAFDTMSWSFLFEVLRHMGFGDLFLRWIGILLQTANTRVTVNGVPGRRFRHNRGLRQGDPTSPMMFVIGMEVLTALVIKATEDNLLSGLAGTTALQRVSIYADDVVLFCKPVEEELATIRQIMEAFGEASGLRVNYMKTTATMIRGSDEELNRAKAIIGYRSQDFPIKKNSRTVADTLLDNSWLRDLGPELSVEGWAQCIRLWDEIELVDRDASRPDRFTWPGSIKGVYSAKDTYRMLCLGQEEFSMYKPIWHSFAPPKCKNFVWLALRYRLWTSDRRHRHGLQDRSAACYWCLQDEDNLDHVLMRCSYARQVWFGCITAAGLNIVEPNRDSSLESWWSSARDLVRRRDRNSFDTLVILIAWQIWKQRNARVFGNTNLQFSTAQMLIYIKEEFGLWKLAKRGEEYQFARE
nr:uncharacterized protein LOC127315326 [Lolium perenne]